MKKALGWAARLGIALAVFTGALLGTAGAASAAPLDVSAPIAASAVAPAIVPMAEGDEGDSISPDETVVMFRWMNGTQNFNFQVDGDPVAAMSRATQRTMFYTLPMSIGNGMWSGTSALLDGAVQFKPMQLVGAEVDAAAAGIGQAIIDSPLIAAAIVMLSFGTIFALKRGERPWRRVWTTAVVAGMFVVMVIGSRTSGGGNGEDYRPGVGSPGWFLTIVSTATAEITTSVAESLTVPSFDSEDGQFCTGYVSDIIKSGNADRAAAGVSLTSTAPMSSALWMQTGMEAWKLAQFGSTSYSERVYCHVLDWAYPTLAKKTLDASGEWPTTGDGANTKSAALSPQNSEQRDRSGIAWAVCYYSGDTWKVRPSWFSEDGGTPKWGPPDTGVGNTWGDPQTAYVGNDGHCAKWWNDDAADWDSSKFKVGPNDGDIKHFMQQNVTSSNRGDVYTFLSNWHGTDSTGIIVTNTYVVSSLIISVAFLIVTAAVFFVNIAIVATMLSIFVVLLVVLFTKNDVESRLMSFVKNLIGLIVFSSVAALLIAMLAKIVEVLGSVGKSLFEGAPIAIMLWVGLSPLFALIMLHFIFTKLIKVPSPFKLSSALAWGTAAGAAGGAAGAGLAARGERAAERAAGQGIKKAGGAIADGAKNLVTGGKRDGAASATDTKSDKVKGAGATTAAADAINESMSAKEIRAERKEALDAAKAELKQGDEEKKSTKFLSAADSILGGKGTIPAKHGWRGAVNRASNALGQGDVLSAKKYADKRDLATRLSEGGMARSAAVLTAAKTSISEGAAGYAEKWRNDPRAAIAQTIKTTAKYGALAVGTAATGGAVGAVYAGVKANQAVRDAGYAGVGLPGGSRQYQERQVSAFQERKQQAAQAQAKQQAELEKVQVREQAREQAKAQRQQAAQPQSAPNPFSAGQPTATSPSGGRRPSDDAGV